MKKIYNIFLMLTLSIVFVSCTHNNGDIGHYFGTWKLDRMTINGADDVDYQNNVLWKFQAGVMCMVRVDDVTHIKTEGWGTWEEDGNILRIGYIHHDDSNPEGSSKYSPLPETHIPKGVTELEILKQNSSTMELKYINNDGQVILYYFDKW